MTIRKHVNNFTTTLYASITDVATTMTLTSVTGLPAIGAGEVFRMTLVSGAAYEIIEVTDDASSPAFTITRGMEGSTARAWSVGTTIQVRGTADSWDRKEDLISARSLTAATVATGDLVLIQDISDSNNLKTVTAQSIADLGGGGGGGGMTMNTASGTTQALAVNNGYICTNASQCVGTLPATAAVGDLVKMVSQGAGGIQMAANTGQTIKGMGDTTTSGGTITPAAQYDSLTVICIVADTTWAIDSFSSSLLTFA